jgi:outer membrane protein TolC
MRTTRLITVFVMCLFAFPPGVSLAGSDASSVRLSLTDAVKMALDNNFDYQNDLLDVDFNESIYRSGMTPYYPRLMLEAGSVTTRPGSDGDSGGSTRNDHLRADLSKRFIAGGGTLSFYSDVTRHNDSESEVERRDEDGLYSNSLGLQFQQPLLKNAGPWNDRITVKQNRLTRENAFFRFVQARRQLVLDVIGLYFAALKQEKLVEVAMRSVHDAQIHLQNSRIKLEEGLVAQMDVSQAELQLARQQTSLIWAQQSAASVSDSLKLKLNITLDKPLEFADTPDHVPEEISLPDAIEEALDQRLDLRILKNDLLSADLAVSQAMNQRLPALDLLFNAESVQWSDRFEDSFRIDDDSRTVQVGFSYTLGDRSHRETWYQARIHLRKQKNNLEKAKKAVEKDVRDEIRHYRALVEALKVSAKALAVAETNFELANQSYREGLTGNLDLLKAQDDLINAGNSYYSDILDLAVAKARIMHVLGREIDPENLFLNAVASGPDQAFESVPEDSSTDTDTGDDQDDE